MMGYIGIAAGICGTDLMVKDTVQTQVKEHQKIYACKDKIIITKYMNPGAALGIFKEYPQLLKGITLFSIGCLTGALAVYDGMKEQSLQKLGLSMMLGGAVSNAWERFKNGKVTDYIQFNFTKSKIGQIVYNIGDFAIFIGSFMLCIGEILRKK